MKDREGKTVGMYVCMHDKCNCSAPTFSRCEQANVNPVRAETPGHILAMSILAMFIRQTIAPNQCQSMSAPAVTEQI